MFARSCKRGITELNWTKPNVLSFNELTNWQAEQAFNLVIGRRVPARSHVDTDALRRFLR